MKEKTLCIVTPDSRCYYRAIPLAKEFLDKDHNLINTTGQRPDGEIIELEVNTQTVKHYKNGKLDGRLEVIDLATGKVTFTETYKAGALIDLADYTMHGTPIAALREQLKPQPHYKGTIVKINKATQSFYKDGKEVAEQTVAANGASLELLGGIPDGPVKEFDDNGQLRSEGVYKDNLLEGPRVHYDEKGRIIARENFVKGQRQGPAQYFTYAMEGPLEIKAQYQNSALNGPWSAIFPNGKTYIQSVYKNGKLSGPRKVLYMDGKTECEENYENGKLSGLRVLYFPEGAVWYRENYKNGRLDGERMCFFPDGHKRLTEYYVDGLLEGTRQIFDEKGALLSNEEYHWGALVHNTERRKL